EPLEPLAADAASCSWATPRDAAQHLRRALCGLRENYAGPGAAGPAAAEGQPLPQRRDRAVDAAAGLARAS
ncbi:unnamed protein product, partial [Effrenium voratum]